MLAVTLLLLELIAGPVAEAKTPEVRIRQQGDLSFGTFMVFGSGARSVSAAGAVIDRSIVPIEGTQARPARFVIEYDRGNESRRTLDVTVEVTLTAPAQVRQGGVDARLSALETDLPGHRNVASGETLQLRLANCRTRVCSRTFNVGARLDVTRHYGGADIFIPIGIDARLISAERL